MKKIIEIFTWQYEGEYEQYFFAVTNETKFIEQLIKHLSEVQVKKEFPWSRIVDGFLEHQRVGIDFIDNNVTHLKETYFVDFEGYGTNKFSVDKRVMDYEYEKFI